MGFKILVVDDIPENLLIIGNILNKENYEVKYANSGFEAIEKAKINDFDLILLDIIMPEMDGYEVCRKLRAEEHTLKIPIIFLTTKTDSESIIKGFELGAQDYVTRPFNPKELLARVHTHIELKNKREELENLNSILEEKVKERTLELEKATKKIESLDKAKSAFLGLISHEIRTPLNGIIGFLEILKSTIDSSNLELVNISLESANRLHSFSELSLLITQLNINSYKLKNEKHDFIELIKEVIERVQNNWKDEKKMEIKLHNKCTNAILKVDKYLIDKVLFSIIDNSIKFSMRPEVNVHIKILNQDRYLVCEIHDDGIGFSKEALNFAFEPFTSNQMRDIEGFGLSLAVSKLILQAHEGKIEIENKPKKGSKVSLFLKDSF
jgi:two-component system sensor histidine kinase/response regulator